MFFADFIRGQSFETIIKGPFFFLYFLPLDFPLPALTFLFAVLSNSSLKPILFNTALTSLVLFKDSTLSSKTNGALSNLIDRVLFSITIDYLRIFTSVINIADIMIVAGVVLLVLSEISKKSKHQSSEQ